jgi:glycerophosphoryl diester phosphodiesterase
MNVELKGSATAKPVSQIIRRFVDGGKIRQEDILVSSFMLDELLIVRKLFPDLKIAPLFFQLPEDFAEIASTLQAWSINLNLKFLTEKDVKQVHASGYKLYVYTVNKAEDKARMQNWGVDGIFTNFP